jgi:hypothetical protein
MFGSAILIGCSDWMKESGNILLAVVEREPFDEPVDAKTFQSLTIF